MLGKSKTLVSRRGRERRTAFIFCYTNAFHANPSHSVSCAAAVDAHICLALFALGRELDVCSLPGMSPRWQLRLVRALCKWDARSSWLGNLRRFVSVFVVAANCRVYWCYNI